MSNFTPGPWTVEERGFQGCDVLAAQVGWSMVPVRIANVVPFKNALQTANLIAAAPELYEALKLAQANLQFLPPTHVEEQIAAALAKAEGC